MKNQNPEPKIQAPDDTDTVRCPRLGHQVPFSYCRKESGTLPCFKALDCWHVKFDAVEFFKTRLTEEEFEKTFGKPAQPKIFSLLDLIEQAKSGGAQKP